MLALRRDDPHAAGPGGPDVSLGVDLRSVGDAGCFVAREVDDQLRIRQGAIGLDVVPADVILAAAVHVEVFFVRRQRETIHGFHVRNHHRQLSVSQHEKAIPLEPFVRVIGPVPQTAEGV